MLQPFLDLRGYLVHLHLELLDGVDAFVGSLQWLLWWIGNAKWTKKNDGFFKIWVNNEIKYDYKGPTKSKQYVYYKFGIYRTGITRYLNYKNLEGLEKCLNNNDWPGNTKRIFYILKSKSIYHKDSIKLYNLCKDYYNPIEIPKTVVYFDEVRKSKKKEKVGIIK